jgi:hypothetical protein
METLKSRIQESGARIQNDKAEAAFIDFSFFRAQTSALFYG